ncbi:peptidoglycan-binding protein [Sphingobium indicum IP26]|uniref:ErfK/YbiS/YcfS/YnhG n=1 Tax=Sphingobium indicum F2 TaxID=1450518 RepID=A0A8E1C1X6_9SPHN|nr:MULTISPECIES: L,D-transpeptidase family protein [Sphingobium]EPR16473.1 peptidoglycan-binding protein [Sphingobium indicum IP26]EQA99258.1 peptidoglycan-binding protein [Sphingobium sp. HDIP04]KER35645.1 ErfK/YbiS/YcfS/YnhG [Sphingobium indicum F2]
MKTYALILASLCSACNMTVTDADESAPSNAASPEGKGAASKPADPYGFVIVPEPAGSPARVEAVLQAQVALDRAGFSPGVLDGKEGMSFTTALKGFQEAKGLPTTGRYDEATARALLGDRPQPATWLVTIPAGFAKGPFFAVPKDLNDQAKLPALGYRNLLEKLAERFHTRPEVLAALNAPDTKVGAGATIRVPAIANQPVARIEGDERGWGETLASLGVAKDQPQADHIVVDKSGGVLRAYDAQNRLIAQFPATMGSQHDPLPIGTWEIKGLSRNPDFHYNPDLFWDASSTDEKAVLKPGPNGPVGVVWIDLSKPHYGIHGTPEPQTIGRTESHGCIRLTNWDAARLAQMVQSGVKAVFQP